MNKLILFLLLVPFVVKGQYNYPGSFEDYHFLKDTINVSKSTQNASFGDQFTPRGDMKGLIIFANFAGTYTNNPSHIEVSNWNQDVVNFSNNYPESVQSDGTALELFYSNNAQFTQYENDQNVKNISKFYYEMSKTSKNQPFRFTCDVYQRNGIPFSVSVNPTGVSSWAGMNQKVIQTIKTDDPSFDWSPYDNRENDPSSNFDKTDVASHPKDKKPDYVVIVYKFNKAIADHLYMYGITSKNMWGWSGSQGGYAAIDGLSSINYNGYTFSDCGFTFCNGESNFVSLFIHEVAHGIYDCPHYGNANNVSGSYFYPENGWGSMNLGSGAFACALGWERWYLDWIELKSNNQSLNADIKTATDLLPSNGEFILNDFITKGDVIRIKIPNGIGMNQYLWIENHQGNSIYDNRNWIKDNDEIYFPPSPRGIVAYIESINDTKSNTSIFTPGAGGIKYIDSRGKFDYTWDPTPINMSHMWGNPVYNHHFGSGNPISGQFPCNAIMGDYNNSGTIYKTFATNSTSQNDEAYWVVKKDNIIVDDFIQSNINFPIGSKMGISTNPSLINSPKYSTASLQGNYYINGISFEVIEQYSDGSIKIKVKFNDVDITNNVRWAGKIILEDVTLNSN